MIGILNTPYLDLSTQKFKQAQIHICTNNWVPQCFLFVYRRFYPTKAVTKTKQETSN